MDRHNTRELAWWRLWTWCNGWAFVPAHMAAMALLGGVVGAACAPVVVALLGVEGSWSVAVVIIAAYLGATVSLAAPRGRSAPRPSAARRGRRALPALPSGSWRRGLGVLLLSTAPLDAWAWYEAMLLRRVPVPEGEPPSLDVLEVLWLPLLWIFLVGAVLLVITVAGIGTGSPSSVQLRAPRSSDLRTAVAASLLGSLVAAAFDFGLPASESPDLLSVAVRLLYWIGVGLVVGLLLGMNVGFVRGGRRAVLRGSPTSLWRQDLAATLSAGLAFAMTAWCVCVFVSATSDLRDGYLMSDVVPTAQELLDWLLLLALLLPAWVIAAAASSEVGRFAVATALFWVRGRAPLRLLRFLEDARERQIIRRAGTVYEFRHARLQSRLVQTSPVGSRSKRSPRAQHRSMSAVGRNA
jgi:hypothetical protein